MTGTSKCYIKCSHECSWRHTILIRTDVFVKFQIKLWSLVVHWNAVPQSMTISCRHREYLSIQTISHAIYHVVPFLHTCVEWIPARFQVPPCYQTRFHVNREKGNPGDWRTQVRHRWCARLAGIMFRCHHIEVLLSLTSIDGSSVTWSAMWSDSQTKRLTTYLSPMSTFTLANRAFRSSTNSL